MERPPYVHVFIDSYLSCARSVELFFRIPVSVTLAYAGVESAWGRSALSKNGVIFGQAMKQEDVTLENSIKVTQIINRKETTRYFKKISKREAFLAYAESLQTNSLFEEAYRHIENPDRFLEVIATGFENVLEKDKAQMARIALKEFKLKEYDSWLYVDLLAS